MLYQSRGLLIQHFWPTGTFFAATDPSGAFLDSLSAEYVRRLRERAEWLIGRFGGSSEAELAELVRQHLGKWGAEFDMESVLWTEELS